MVIVSWNAPEFLTTAIEAIRRFAPDVEVLVVDNHSDVDPRSSLDSSIRAIRLPANIGHGPALDVGFLLARTETVVALDVDAFPIDPAWLDVFVGPLRSGATVVGCATHRPFAHPCCLAMDKARFVRRRHSFTAQWRGDYGFDVAELVSAREGDGVVIVPATASMGPGYVGSVYGGVVYHNWYGTRHLREEMPDEAVLDGGMVRARALEVYELARAAYLTTDAVGDAAPEASG